MSYLSEDAKHQARERLQQAIDAGDTAAAVELAEDALARGLEPGDFFGGVVEPVLAEVGERFARLEVFLPDLMKAGVVAKAMQQEVLEPAIRRQGSQMGTAGMVVIGTCQGDIHDIGKNMVALMLQVNGFRVFDLGTNVAPRAFIDAAKREQADIIAMSSLLTPSIPFIRDVAQLLSGYGLREQFLIVAGGAAVSRQWTESAGIDGFGEDAVEAVSVCRALMAERRGKAV